MCHNIDADRIFQKHTQFSFSLFFFSTNTFFGHKTDSESPKNALMVDYDSESPKNALMVDLTT